MKRNSTIKMAIATLAIGAAMALPSFASAQGHHGGRPSNNHVSVRLGPVNVDLGGRSRSYNNGYSGYGYGSGRYGYDNYGYDRNHRYLDEHAYRDHRREDEHAYRDHRDEDRYYGSSRSHMRRDERAYRDHRRQDDHDYRDHRRGGHW